MARQRVNVWKKKIEIIDDAAKKDLQAVFDAVASGSIRVAWYDMPPVNRSNGSISVMRYALHRSSKQVGFLQLSCMEIIDGYSIIPTSDDQYNINDDGFADFWRSVPSVMHFNFM